MASKKVKRDDKGHPIVIGAKTFGNIIRPKRKFKERAYDLKDKADTKLLLLMKQGVMADKLAKPFKPLVSESECESLKFQKEFAEAPKIVQLAHYNNKLNDLKDELDKLEEGGNKKKIEFMKQFIESEIVKLEAKIYETYIDFKEEQRLKNLEKYYD